jgi:hypothetical protein
MISSRAQNMHYPLPSLPPFLRLSFVKVLPHIIHHKKILTFVGIFNIHMVLNTLIGTLVYKALYRDSKIPNYLFITSPQIDIMDNVK